MSVDNLIETISKNAGISAKEVEKLIEEKQEELSGLVSEEGAAYIVGRELGVSLLKEGRKRLKIKNIVSGMNSVDVVGKVTKIFEPREFVKNDRKGTVVNIMVGDETGTIRLSLWDREVDLVKTGAIKEDDTVKITGGFVREGERLELRLGKGKIEKIQEEIEVIKEPAYSRFPEIRPKRATLDKLNQGDMGEVRASIVQLFRRNPFFYSCPTCGKSAEEKEEKYTCKEHGEVEPKFQMVISGVMDDGYGNMRVVFFRELAERIFGKDTEELRKLMEKKKDPLDIYDSFAGLGRDYIFRGLVKKNNFTENLEFIVNGIEEVDVKREIEGLLKENGLP